MIRQSRNRSVAVFTSFPFHTQPTQDCVEKLHKKHIPAILPNINRGQRKNSQRDKWSVKSLERFTGALIFLLCKNNNMIHLKILCFRGSQQHIQVPGAHRSDL